MIEQRFFDWTDLQFSPGEYHARRRKLISLLQESGGGLFLAPSQSSRVDGTTFRQLDDFLYFTGLELPDSLLCIDSDAGRTTLFVPERDPRFDHPTRKNDFPGRPLQTDPTLAKRSKLKDIRPSNELTPFLDEVALQKQTVRLNPGHPGEIKSLMPPLIQVWTPAETLLFHLQTTYLGLTITTAYPQIARLRMVKSAAEVEAIRQACQLGMQGIRAVAPQIRPGVDERTLAGNLEAAYKRGGAQRLPFDSTIKSGPNSLWPGPILAAHYNRRNRVLAAGELAIFDVGCELNYYSSDIGRTFPVSEQFSPAQRDILQLQLAVSDTIIAAIHPGVTLMDLRQVVLAAIPAEVKPYMQTGLFFGHHLGLAVGDPSLTDVELTAGMVITVEPWYYNHQAQLATFLEDAILVTANGQENLTANLSRTPAGLEALKAS